MPKKETILTVGPNPIDWLWKDVQLNREGRKLRVDGMRRLEGLVVAVKDLPRTKNCLIVDWGEGRMWSENPEDLVVIDFSR